MSQDARHHANLSVELAAAGRWSEALSEAHACYRLAPAGSTLSVWALHQLAVLYVDSGVPGKAEAFARAYLQQADQHPKLESFTPYVVQVLGVAAYQRGRYQTAFSWLLKASALFARQGNHARVAAVSSQLVWTLVRLDRASQAREWLVPRRQFPENRAYLYDGAMAAILYAEGKYEEAVQAGREALNAPSRQAYDFANAAGVAIVVARSLARLGDKVSSSALLDHAAELHALQEWATFVRSLLNGRARGGDPSDSATSHGSRDLHDRGCFTTGVA